MKKINELYYIGNFESILWAKGEINEYKLHEVLITIKLFIEKSIPMTKSLYKHDYNSILKFLP